MGLINLKSNLTWPSTNHPGNPPAVDFFDNNKSGATGFTNKIETIPASIRSGFIGITNLGTQYTYPSSVMAGRLMNPPGSINFPTVKFPGPQNFFDNIKSGATGFTNKMMPIGTAVAKSQFIGVSKDETQYTYPATVMSNRLMQPPATQNPRSNVKYKVSAFPGPQNFFEDKYATGFTTNMYPIGAPKQNSQFLAVSNPDLLTSQYNNPTLNLQGEQTPNTYIKQPFILRGIQRPGNKAKPQRWGFGLTFDDGFMRGGIVTATERSLVDVLRLGKWMITPKGLLWNVKQLGLGFTNPNVETLSSTVKVAPTRLHLGPSTLLSVAGNAFGQHFTRHGLPFVSSLGNYGNVQIAKRVDFVIAGNPESNRLVKLKNTLIQPDNLFPINIIDSSLGGANSVYGIGRTDIKRYVNSNDGFHDSVVARLFKNLTEFSSQNILSLASNIEDYRYRIGNQYFSIDSKSTYKTANDVDDKRQSETIQTVSNLVDDSNKAVIPNTNIVIDDTNTKDITSLSKPENLETGVVGKYATLAYGQLKKSDTGDFRKNLYSGFKFLGAPVDYSNENIEKKYKIGTPEEYDVDTDFIPFTFGNIQFRAFLDSISDSFSPTWNAEFDQGRADARVLYGSFSRSIGISFRIAAFSKQQIETIYYKMDQLAKLTMPNYGAETFSGMFTKLTVGNLYSNVDGYIDSLTYDWDSETPWELDGGKQVPFYVSVSVNFVWIGANRPDQTEAVFSLNSKN